MTNWFDRFKRRLHWPAGPADAREPPGNGRLSAVARSVRRRLPEPESPPIQGPGAGGARPPCPGVVGPVADLTGRLEECFERVVRSPDAASLVDSERQYEQQLARLTEWVREGDLFPPPRAELRHAYLAALWRILRALRRDRPGDALHVWALLQATTDQCQPEVIRLALRVLKEFRVSPPPAPRGREWTVAIAAASRIVVERPMPDAVDAALQIPLDLLRIDWTLSDLEEVASRQGACGRLLPLLKTMVPAAVESLEFWNILGLWRCDPAAEPAVLRERLRSLALAARAGAPERPLYFWCLARLAYEAAGNWRKPTQASQVSAVEDVLRLWHAVQVGWSTADLAAKLSDYFRLLTITEVGLQLRRPVHNLPSRLVPELSQKLETGSQTVRPCAVICEHVRPVLERLAERARQAPAVVSESN